MEHLKFDFTNIFGDKAKGENFLTPEDIENIKERIETAHRQIKKEKETRKELTFLFLPEAYDKSHGKTVFGNVLWEAKRTIDEMAVKIREEYTDYVQLAIGGSALGAIALCNALGDNKTKCRIHMPDNIDPDWLGDILNSIDKKTTFFNIVSKSGGTVETLANFFVFYNAIKQVVPEEKLKNNIAVMTNPDKGPLAELCRIEGFPLVPIPESVHGRFSIFSPGGLLTAAVAGIDIDELLEGARVMNQKTDEADFWNNPVLIYAAIHYLANVEKNIDTLILLPYAHGLRTVADWYSQLVAESLGKKGKGITPVKALGATDQHSQLQLYNDGPKNKFVTFFSVDKFKREIKIPAEFPECKDYQFLWGHTINDLLESEKKATAISLYNNSVPNCTFQLPKMTPYYIGQLFMLLEKVIPVLEKMYAVNAFDQPGVEESKEYARAMLGKEGDRYDEIRKEVESFSDPSIQRII